MGSGQLCLFYARPEDHTPPGDYSVRVIESSTAVSACSWSNHEASEFFGNFSLVNDRGLVHVNCLQYLPESQVNSAGEWLADGEYDFSIAPQGCSIAEVVTNVNNAVDNVMTDCATCYSTRFLNNAELDIDIDQPANIGANGTYEMWFKANGVTTGDVLQVWSGTDHMTLSLETDNTPLNQGGMKFSFRKNSNEVQAHTGTPLGFNEFIIHADTWYHVALNTGSNGGLILRERTTTTTISQHGTTPASGIGGGSRIGGQRTGNPQPHHPRRSGCLHPPHVHLEWPEQRGIQIPRHRTVRRCDQR